ncbi:MAG: hypothetical protein MK193_03570 [Lentisphaeria bacterium]|nr:hypothetical protein [Lentisphaeria bacterium]
MKAYSVINIFPQLVNQIIDQAGKFPVNQYGLMPLSIDQFLVEHVTRNSSSIFKQNQLYEIKKRLEHKMVLHYQDRDIIEPVIAEKICEAKRSYVDCLPAFLVANLPIFLNDYMLLEEWLDLQCIFRIDTPDRLFFDSLTASGMDLDTEAGAVFFNMYYDYMDMMEKLEEHAALKGVAIKLIEHNRNDDAGSLCKKILREIALLGELGPQHNAETSG